MEKPRSSSGKGSSTEKDKKSRATWTNAQTTFLVFMMKEYADAGKFRGQNGWAKEGWNAMTQRLNLKHPGADFTKQQVKDREQRLKQDHNVVRSILEKNGFGWDPEKGVPTAPDEKWDELSKAQQKWRFKAFPHYDVLYEIYEGKIASGRRCKRTTDNIDEKYNIPDYPEHESYTNEVLRESGLDSPQPTLSAPGSSMPAYDWNNNIYGDDVDLTYGGYTEPVSNGQQSSAVEDHSCVDSPRKKRLRDSKGFDGGSEKTKAKKGKDTMLENLVSVREEELKTYKEMKTKQIDSYKDIKMAQMERNDPKNDPYGMPNCIQKLKTLGLPPSEQYKVINHLKEDMLNRQTFMEVDADVLDEIIKVVVQEKV
uniref:Uncharacterized protein n=1 Tax=Avena sativa TaxID=4498 RepID=A0ACD5UYK0_AVESA